MWYVANLASEDLRLTFLTPFNANNFSWRGVGGDKKCKRFRFIITTSYRKLNEETSEESHNRRFGFALRKINIL